MPPRIGLEWFGRVYIGRFDHQVGSSQEAVDRVAGGLDFWLHLGDFIYEWLGVVEKQITVVPEWHWHPKMSFRWGSI